ncbi:hypothetical protein DFJ77DRAFT_478067 [Powellomyces hirtus]|nr:hypothetical protein DFJ77DRAFT_478067 [Powellomyces hirtus]
MNSLCPAAMRISPTPVGSRVCHQRQTRPIQCYPQLTNARLYSTHLPQKHRTTSKNPMSIDVSTLQSILAAAQDGSDNGFFAVTPRTDCPHVPGTVRADAVDITSPCSACGDSNENWRCVECQGIFCSRYVQGHMQAHYDQARHPVAVSYTDLSSWCYECSDYIDSPILHPLRSAIHEQKFGHPMPRASSTAAAPDPAPSGSDAKGKGPQPIP